MFGESLCLALGRYCDLLMAYCAAYKTFNPPYTETLLYSLCLDLDYMYTKSTYI